MINGQYALFQSRFIFYNSRYCQVARFILTKQRIYPYLNFLAVQSSPRPGQFLFHSQENWILSWQMQIYNCVSTIGRWREYTKRGGGGVTRATLSPQILAPVLRAPKGPQAPTCANHPSLLPSLVAGCRAFGLHHSFKSTQFNKIFNSSVRDQLQNWQTRACSGINLKRERTQRLVLKSEHWEDNPLKCKTSKSQWLNQNCTSWDSTPDKGGGSQATKGKRLNDREINADNSAIKTCHSKYKHNTTSNTGKTGRL